MSVDKIILKAALTTLAAIGALLLFIAVALCGIFPSTMMEITYDLGMEKSCIHFAERAYKGSSDVHFIAYATEVAIEDDRTDKIASCGEKYVCHKDFKEYCENNDKSEAYVKLIYARVCVSKYQMADKVGAIELALQTLNGGFPEGNAMVALLLEANAKNDAPTKNLIKEKLQGITGKDENEQKYLDETLQYLG